jgi:hypothetical protein
VKRLKGPELKMPELKVPDFVTDLYWDLRDRRLLPLVALAIVAIVAVPFLLGGGSKESPPLPPAAASALPANGEHGATLTVVQAKPGLRDYRRRLARRSPTDPFKPHYAGSMLKGAELNSQSETGSGATETSTSATFESTTTSTGSTPTPSSPSSGNDGGGGADSGNGQPQITLFAFAIDVKITRTETKEDGSKEQSDPETRKHVLAPAALPSKKTAVITYMGINPKTKLPLLLISDQVTGVFGEGKCLSGAGSCQLLEVEPTYPVTFVLEGGTRYKINVLKVEPVTAGKY